MDPRKPSTESLTTERLQLVRKITDRIADHLHGQVKTYLGTLRPTLAPHRVLGKHVEHPGNRSAAGEDKVWAKLSASYRKVAARLSAIPSELRSPLPPIDPTVELYPWEYVHKADGQSITVTSPTKWVMIYHSDITFSQFRQALPSGGQARHLLTFVVNALVMEAVVDASPKMGELFGALRLELGEEKSSETGGLSFTTLTSVLDSYLPADDVVVPTTRLTGIPRFSELIEPESVATLTDPLRDELQALVKQA